MGDLIGLLKMKVRLDNSSANLFTEVYIFFKLPKYSFFYWHTQRKFSLGGGSKHFTMHEKS